MEATLQEVESGQKAMSAWRLEGLKADIKRLQEKVEIEITGVAGPAKARAGNLRGGIAARCARYEKAREELFALGRDIPGSMELAKQEIREAQPLIPSLRL
jgi:hypothetical protein